MDNFINFLLYFSTSVLALTLFMFIYTKTTPYNEFKLIFEEGNSAAAYALVGSILGFVIPIASVLAHSVSYYDFVLWGFISGVVQVTVAFIIIKVFKNFEVLVKEDLTAAGIFLGGTHLAVGILNAASVTY